MDNVSRSIYNYLDTVSRLSVHAEDAEAAGCDEEDA
jgi:hypothetical protein